jgi:threonine aldolase
VVKLTVQDIKEAIKQALMTEPSPLVGRESTCVPLVVYLNQHSGAVAGAKFPQYGYRASFKERGYAIIIPSDSHLPREETTALAALTPIA